MRAEVESQVEADSRESFKELLSQLADQVTDLVRQEIALAKVEIGEKTKILPVSILMVSAGIFLAQAGILALCAAAVIALADFVGFALSALIVGVVLAVIGGLLGFFGMRRLKWQNLKPEKTIETLKGGFTGG